MDIFTLKIKLDNAAFEDPTELARILREAARKVEAGERNAWLLDSNGNRVGRFVTT